MNVAKRLEIETITWDDLRTFPMTPVTKKLKYRGFRYQ